MFILINLTLCFLIIVFHVQVKKILENPQGLAEQSSCHEFCRLLARLKSNYQLGELVKVESYADTIRLISEFTVTCIQMPQFGANSLHYLLSLWQRMVASMSYVKATEPHLLEVYTPQIVHAYLTSRLDIAAKVSGEMFYRWTHINLL